MAKIVNKKKAASKRIEIKVKDIIYPCYPTMGAAVGFKDLTGRDIEEIAGTSDFAKYIYCCAKSASRREGKEFNMSLEDFCDSVLIEDLNSLNGDMSAGNADDDAKKN